MSDAEILILALVAIYLYECVLWTRPDTFVFSPDWLGRARVRVAPPVIAALQRGPTLAHPGMPWLPSVSLTRWPLSVSPDGGVGFVSASPNPGPRPPQTLSFAQMHELKDAAADHHKVHLRGRVLLELDTPLEADWYARWCRSLAEAPPGNRANRIERTLIGMFDEAAARARLDEVTRRTAALRTAGTVLFAYLVVIVPTVVTIAGLPATWLWLLTGLLPIWISATVLFARAGRAISPLAVGARRWQLLEIGLLPVAAIRGYERVWRGALAGFHPLTVARIWLDEEQFRSFAKRVARDSSHPIPMNDAPLSPDARACAQWFEERFNAALRSFLDRCGIDAAAMSARPAVIDPSIRGYCPRCQAPYTIESGTCAACEGVPLAAISAEPLAENAREP